MLHNHKTLLAVLAAAMCCACTSELEAPAAQGTDLNAQGSSDELQITAHIDGATRLATSGEIAETFDVNSDYIGIFIVEHGKAFADIAKPAAGKREEADKAQVWLFNQKFRIANANGTLEIVCADDDQIRFWPKISDGNKQYDVYAYYPYNEALTSIADGKFYTGRTITANQNVSGNAVDATAPFELLAAAKQVTHKDKINLTFKHMLSVLDVKVTGAQLARVGGGYDNTKKQLYLTGVKNVYDAAFQQIDANGTKATPATVTTPATATVADAATATNVFLKPFIKTGDGAAAVYTYRAYLPAQAVPQNSVFNLRSTLTPVKDVEMYKLPADLTLVAGQADQYNYNAASGNTLNTLYPVSLSTTSKATGSINIDGTTVSISGFKYTPLITTQQYCDFLNAVGATYNTSTFAASCATSSTFSSVPDNTVLVYASNQMDGAAYNTGVAYSSNKWVPAVAGNAGQPVNYVTWYGAKAYAEWAYGDLLTEAEWDKANANGVNLNGNTIAQTNKWEWVNDWYKDETSSVNAYPFSANNPTGPTTGTYKVYRNGEAGRYTYGSSDANYYVFRSQANPNHTYGMMAFRIKLKR